MKLVVRYGNQPLTFFKKQDRLISERIMDKINELVDNPIPHDAKRVEGKRELVFRIRVGKNRVLYEVDYDNNIIGIIKIGNREEVYN